MGVDLINEVLKFSTSTKSIFLQHFLQVMLLQSHHRIGGRWAIRIYFFPGGVGVAFAKAQAFGNYLVIGHFDLFSATSL